MKIGILKEQIDKRVAIVPAAVKKLKALGLDVLLETTAGENSNFDDDTYTDVTIVPRQQVLSDSDVIVSVYPPSDSDVEATKKGTVFVALFEPYNKPSVADIFKKQEVHAFSLDMIPRTTLAQAMDVLSSMASIAGYKAVLTAANYLPRYFPMMITAAGSIKPSRVLVLGAGVAGLQAIATAKRLGAMVEAFDVRKAAKEEVESLGAKFVEVEGAADDSAAGGYAVEQSEEFLKRQRAEVQSRAMKADVIITTAQVRGRKAPILVPKTTVEAMKAGSVIVDLAASTGGNCEVTEDAKIIQHKGVTVIGNSALAETMAQDASTLYCNNILNFLKLIVKDGTLNIDMENEIVSSTLITKNEA